MKKLNITKKQFTESKYFQRKYGKLEYVSESGKLFKTNKGKVLKFKEAREDASVESSWFDDYGYLVKPLPGACVVDCSGSGRKDDAVDYWMRELGFDIGFPVAKAVKFLKEFGAWDDLDLLAEVASTGDIRKMRQWFRDQGNEMDDTEHFNAKLAATRVLAQRVLWEFCNEIREQAYDGPEEDLDSVGLLDDPNDWDDEDWVKFQTELSCVSL